MWTSSPSVRNYDSVVCVPVEVAEGRESLAKWPLTVGQKLEMEVARLGGHQGEKDAELVGILHGLPMRASVRCPVAAERDALGRVA